MKSLGVSLFLLFALVLSVPASADDKKSDEAKPVDLKVGDKAPVFKSVGDDGKPWNSADHVGKKIVVVYFYPADMTGGCTKQACGFRDDMTKLKDEGVEIVGVSGDSVENHVIFKKEYDLNFTLLADEKGSVAKAFGVPTGPGGSIQRTVDGKDVTMTRGVTTKRWTFVIDQHGKIASKNTEVKAAEDSKAIIKLVGDLKAKK
ncbi:redoxin domain-containing protein [bacterium]|nr:redoxin domain-containing protein [bacterium]